MPCRSASVSLPVAMANSSRPADQRRHRVRRRAVHPDPAVPVQRHEPEGGVDHRVDHGQVQAVPVGDLGPVGDAGAAERVSADPHPGRPDRVQVDHRRAARPRTRRGSRSAHGRAPWPALAAPGAPRAGRRAAARWPGPGSREVICEPAGPPSGGLYLNPPSSGGLCDGVTTIPSARPSVPVRGCASGWPATGPGSACSRPGCRPGPPRSLAASTSSAVTKAGSDSACVSRPRNSGPVVPAAAR